MAVPPPADQWQRDRITTELERSFLVEAGAGSGKTTALVARLVALLATGQAKVEQIAAMTFTRKAAAEMRQRLLQTLEERSQEATQADATDPQVRARLRAALMEQDRLYLGTIHAFCARLLRERPLEAGAPADFEELDETQDLAFARQCWDAFTEELQVRQDSLVQRLADVGLELAALRFAFERMLAYRDITHWPAEAVGPPPAEPLRTELELWHRRLDDVLAKVEGQRYTCGLLRHFARVRRHARILDLSRRVDLMEHVELCLKKPKELRKTQWPKEIPAAQMAQEWNGLVEGTLRPALAQWYAHRYPVALTVLRRAVAFAAEQRQRLGKLNFQDLLLGAARLLRDHPAARRALQQRWTHLLVDEFQDTDPVQAEVLLLLSDAGQAETWRAARPRPGSLFIVGDPQQSIYRFRRADLTTYQQVKELLLAAGGEVLHLTTNFRARPELVDWTNATFAAELPAEPTATMPAFQPLTANPAAQRNPSPYLLRLDLSEKRGKRARRAVVEAEAIARFIAQDRRQTGRPYSAYLLLTRAKTRLKDYAAVFAAHDIPFQVSGGTRLREMPEFRLLVQWVEAVACPEDPIALVALLRGPAFGFCDPQLFDFHECGGRFDWRRTLPANLPGRQAWERAWRRLRELDAQFRTLPPVAVLERLLTGGGLLARTALVGGGAEAIHNLAKLLSMVRAERQELLTPRDLLRFLRGWLESEKEADGLSLPAEVAPAVRIMNLHKAKGLQAEVVFLVDPNKPGEHTIHLHVDRTQEPSQGYLSIRGREMLHHPGPLLAQPLSWPQWEAKERAHVADEERRLVYVAATRAGQLLVVSDVEGEHQWSLLTPHLAGAATLQDQLAPAAGDQVPVAPPPWPLPEAADVAQHWQRVLPATERSAALKAWALSTTPPLRRRRVPPTWSAEQGTSWGALIHALLEARLRQGDVPDPRLAAALLEELDLDPELLPHALEQVEKVVTSDLWRRARHALRCLSEVPIAAVLEPEDLLVHGVIDLAFEELLGWVIVDYKTDQVSRGRLNRLAEHYRPQLEAYARVWEQVTSSTVIEYGIFWTRLGQYQALRLH